MIGYVTLGTNDLNRAAGFYDALLAELGATRFMDTEGFIAWAVNPQTPALSLTAPHMVSRRLRATGQWLRWQRTRRLQSMRCIAKPSSWVEHAKDHQAREENRFMPAISVILKGTSSMYSA